MEICSICQVPFAEHACHALDECGHRFHTACVIRWFRTNGSCPLCRGEQNTYIGYLDTLCRYKMLRRKSKARRAPAKLKAFVKRICRAEDALKLKKKKMKELRAERAGEVEDGSMTVQQVLTKVRLSKQVVSAAERRLWCLKRTLGMSDFETPGFRLPNVVSGERRSMRGRRVLRSRRV